MVLQQGKCFTVSRRRSLTPSPPDSGARPQCYHRKIATVHLLVIMWQRSVVSIPPKHTKLLAGTECLCILAASKCSTMQTTPSVFVEWMHLLVGLLTD